MSLNDPKNPFSSNLEFAHFWSWGGLNFLLLDKAEIVTENKLNLLTKFLTDIEHQKSIKINTANDQMTNNLTSQIAFQTVDTEHEWNSDLLT